MSIAAIRSNRGDEYQLCIAVHWLIRLFSENKLDWVQVEAMVLPNQTDKVYVDDIVIHYNDDSYCFVQAKKNQTDREAWSLSDKKLEEELQKAYHQFQNNPKGRIMFYSQTPFGELAKLIEDSSHFEKYPVFVAQTPETLRSTLKKLAKIIKSSEEEAYALCQHMEIGPHHTFADWDRNNLADLQRHVADPETARTVLERLLGNSQSRLRDSKSRLTREDVIAELAKHHIIIASCRTEAEILEEFKLASSMGRQDLSRDIAREKIYRPQLSQIIDSLERGEKTILLTDRPGSGKSWLLLELADEMETKPQWGMLFIKGDHFDQVISEGSLPQYGLPKDIVGSTSRLTAYRKVLIIIDSLDVLSLSRDHHALQVFLSLLDRLEPLPKVSIVAACRSFDLDYHPLLRHRQWTQKIAVPGLDFELNVAPLLRKWNIDPQSVSKEQQALLSLPQNLKLLEKFDNKAIVVVSLTSSHQLQEAFLEEVIGKQPHLGETAILALQQMAEKLMKQRRLSLPKEAFTANENIRHGLISVGALREDKHQLAFTHQTLFDTLVIRNALIRGETLEQFIVNQSPLPFIRPAVRTFFFYLRVYDPKKFVPQFKKVLGNTQIAYHLKRLLVESLADIHPESGDLSLVKWLLKEHTDFFRRFLEILKQEVWFDILYKEILQQLLSHSSHGNFKLAVIRKLNNWMNTRPNEVISLWLLVLQNYHGEPGLLWQILIGLQKFKHWEIPEIREVLVLLMSMNVDEERWLGKAISQYVETTGQGDELLWSYMVAKLPSAVEVAESFYKLKDKLLKCEPDTFHHQEFLKQRLCVSDQLLTFFVEAIEEWSSKWFNYPEQRTFRNLFLRETSWRYTHEQVDGHSVDSFTEVFDAVESALNHKSKQYDEWWQTHEPSLRQTQEAALAYLLIQAYRQNIESNISGIEAFLNREEVLQQIELNYEGGELVRDAYPYFSTEIQEQFQMKILSLTSPYKEENVTEEEPIWLYSQRYIYLCWIPKFFRLPEVQTFIEKWELRFGLWPQPPDLYLQGAGFVGSPVSVEQMMSFSEETLVRLFKHYNQYNQYFFKLTVEGLEGGTEQVVSTFGDCCSQFPLKFASLIERVYAENIYGGYAVAIMRGVASHLEYRFGNIQPPNGWQPVTSLPDGNALALLVLNWLIKYPNVWQDGYTVTSMLRACCHVLTTPEEVEWLTLLLWRLANHHDPKETALEQDLRMTSLNSVRGKVAESAMILATNLLEKGRPWPELLQPLLFKFAQDSVAGVRVSILTRLPLLAHYETDLGWNIFHRTFKNSPPQLWVHGEQFLYYQYHKNFTQVQPCLNRIKEEAIETAGAVWGRITTLAYLSGHLTEEELFEQLSQLNHQEIWLGTIRFFCANLDNAKHKLTCEQGLLRILKLNSVLSQEMNSAFEKFSKSSKEVQVQLADAFIDSWDNNEKRPFSFFFFEWVAKFSNEEPHLALTVCEKLLDKFERAGCSHPLWHDGHPLVEAAISILREADEMDDPEWIKRAVALQDKLLKLGLSEEMTKALDNMARNT